MEFKELLKPAGIPNDVAVIEHLRESGLPVVLYGATEDVAGRIARKLAANRITVAAVAFGDGAPLTADMSAFPQQVEAIPVHALDERFAACNLVAGFVKGYMPNMAQTLAGASPVNMRSVRSVSYLSEIFDMETISPAFVPENRHFLEDFCENLADQRSKDAFVAYLMSKTRQDMKYLPPVFDKDQYFPAGIFDLSGGNESYFDCGAFTGDTVAGFLQAAGGRYRHIWAVEPDRSSYQQLAQYVEREKLTDIDLINKGVYGYAGKLPFREEGNMLSMFADGADCCTETETDTIDNIAAGKPVTYIKLDVEGAELPALKGAEQTIRTYRPILGISIYHKERDLIDIPPFLNGIAPGYRFYFRTHKKLAIDAVLYAVNGDSRKHEYSF